MLILITLDEYKLAWVWPLVAMFLGWIMFLVGQRFAENILRILEILFPVIGKLLNNAKRRVECNTMVRNMEYVFQHFHLFRRLKPEYYHESTNGEFIFTEALKKDLEDGLMRAGVTTDPIVYLAEALVDLMTAPVTIQTLILLYKERFSILTPVEFQQAKQDVQTMKNLAAVLEQGVLLPDHGNLLTKSKPPSKRELLEQGFLPNDRCVFPYKDDDVVRILMTMDNFSVHQVSEWMRRLEELWNIVRGYLAFLIENQVVPESTTIEVAHVLDLISSPHAHPERPDLLKRLADWETVIPSLLSHCWLETVQTVKAASTGEGEEIKKVFGNLDDSTLDNIGLISQILYFFEKRRDCMELKRKACILAARDPNAVRMAMAYLEYREDLREQTALDGLPFVSLRYLAQNWSKTIEKREGELGAGFQKELNVLREYLQNGVWLTRLSPVLEEVYRKVDRDLKRDKERLEEKSRRHPGIGEALKRVFLNLRLETIERFLETRTITAYLLTFDSRQGSLANLIDCLRDPRCRPKLEKEGVCFEVYGRPKYVFEDYTAHSRIGVTPLGVSFETFYQMLEDDLIRLSDYRQHANIPHSLINKFEIILHRFGLFGRDRYHFDGFLSDRQVQDAREKIQKVLAQSLSSSEMTNVIAYEQEETRGKVTLGKILKDIIIMGQIADFVVPQLSELTQEQSRALANNDKNLKDDLLRHMRQPDLLALAQAIAKSKTQRENAKVCLSTLIGTLPAFKAQTKVNLCDQIAQIYIDTFADIISIC